MIYTPLPLDRWLRSAYESGYVAGASGVAEVSALGMIARFVQAARDKVGSISAEERNALARSWKDGYKTALERIREGALHPNPGRPPREWMYDCVKGASKSADDSGAVCGSLWFHKMSPAQKRAALRKERSR